jgi:transposase
MNQYVGLDVSLEQTAICVVDDNGKPVWQGKCASTSYDRSWVTTV